MSLEARVMVVVCHKLTTSDLVPQMARAATVAVVVENPARKPTPMNVAVVMERQKEIQPRMCTNKKMGRGVNPPCANSFRPMPPRSLVHCSSKLVLRNA